ncbi:MAG: VWA domain-containing protein [Gammaproteobacteria bacterium]|nr:MAG: VWA domain-containing protein [Gammaproteobacteria bacterium]
MSCGLGAIILVFMLVKHNVNDSSVELDNLKNDIQNLESKKENSLQTLKSIEAQLTKDAIQAATAKRKLAEQQLILAQNNTDIEKATKEIETLKSDIKDIKIVKKADLIETEQINEESYLLGLKVEGQKIALLVDSSASMTNEKLIDIIKTKSSSNKDKQQAKKWTRTKKIVAWLLARLPQDSDVVVVAFNEKAKILGNQGWMNASNPTNIQAILSDLNGLIPEGATNLHHGLQTVNKFVPSNLYIITDGLPTKGESNYKSLNPFSSCSSLLGNSNIISGACRVKLFRQTINESAKSGVQVDVVLLPLEGDPDAINQYWNWTATTGGLVISPANNWP